MGNAFFITGTGTDIGKTVVTCSLIKQLLEAGKNVMAIKPIISGWEDDITNDTFQILTSLGMPHSQENINKISPYRFKAPLAPSMAAKKEGRIIDYNSVIEFCKAAQESHEYFFCEGAGGVAVPINENKTTLDLMADLQFPAFLVCGTYLGAISHALTAIKSMETMGIKIHAVIVNESLSGIGLSDTILELQNFINYPIIPMNRVTDNNKSVWKKTVNILSSISN